MNARTYQFRRVNTAPSRAVTTVRDWAAPNEAEMLREKVVDLGIVRLKGMAARAWTDWAEGRIHKMPKFEIDSGEYRQYVVLRLEAFDAALKNARSSPSPEAVEALENYSEYHAFRWSHAEVHLPPPVFLPGHHERSMKRERQRLFWEGLSRGDDLREWPEYQLIAKDAGFQPKETIPVIKVERPYLPQPRQAASRWAKRGYHRLQARWEAAYGPGRKLIVNALKRKRREMHLSAIVVA